MKSKIFIYFFIIIGFFSGLILGVLNGKTAEDFLSIVLFSMLFFYLFIHIIIGFFYLTLIDKNTRFNKNEHEKKLDIYINEVNKREKFVDNYHSLKNEEN